MFDNLRDLSETPADDQNQDDDLFKDMEEVEPAVTAPERPRRKNTNFLGMTSQQRFLISVMLMFTVLLLGMFAMLVLGRMSIF